MEKQITTYYYQVYRDMVMQIYGGRYKKGSTLPSLKELCNIYGIGRNTARSALQQLERHGYIKTEPRKAAVVIFDMNNLKYRSFYLSELASRKEAILQAYDFMELAFPEIFIFILQNQPKSVRMEIAGLVGLFAENLVVQSEAEMSAYVLQLYKLVIALADSQLLEQLFSSVYSFIQVPVSVSEWDRVKFKAIGPLFKSTFKKFQRQLEAEDYKKLKSQIQMLCQVTKKRSKGYLEKTCKNIIPDVVEGFLWNVKGMQETEYVQLASDIMEGMRTGIYKKGDILPSYAQLGVDHHVSEKTSRAAIELLGRLKLVSTINGVGTKVIGFCIDSREIFLKDKDMTKFIRSFFEALQIVIILCKPLLQTAVYNLSKEEYYKLEEQILDNNMIKVFDILLPYANLPTASIIYSQLKKDLIWGHLLNCDIKWKKNFNAPGSLSVRKTNLINEIYDVCLQYYKNAQSIIDEYSIEIQLGTKLE